MQNHLTEVFAGAKRSLIGPRVFYCCSRVVPAFEQKILLLFPCFRLYQKSRLKYTDNIYRHGDNNGKTRGQQWEHTGTNQVTFCTVATPHSGVFCNTLTLFDINIRCVIGYITHKLVPGSYGIERNGLPYTEDWFCRIFY